MRLPVRGDDRAVAVGHERLVGDGHEHDGVGFGGAALAVVLREAHREHAVLREWDVTRAPASCRMCPSSTYRRRPRRPSRRGNPSSGPTEAAAMPSPASGCLLKRESSLVAYTDGSSNLCMSPCHVHQTCMCSLIGLSDNYVQSSICIYLYLRW